MSKNKRSNKLTPKPKCRLVNKEVKKQTDSVRLPRVSSKSSDDGISIKAVNGPITRPKRVSSGSSDQPKPVDDSSNGLS